MAEIKGVLLNAWITFLKNRYGEQAVADAIGKIATGDLFLLSGRFLDSSWYRYETLHTLRRVTRPLAGPTDQNMAVEIGRFMADYVFTGVYRSFLVPGPVQQVQKFSSIGDFFFREARKLETEIKGPSQCLVRYTYEPGATPTRSICESLTGFWSRTLELSGAAKVSATHLSCVTRGAQCCEFVFEW